MSHAFSPADQLAALRVAADVLRARQPCHGSRCTVQVGPNQCDAHAEWRWPGVVRVTLCWTGELIACSLPGQPYVVDPAHEGGHA